MRTVDSLPVWKPRLCTMRRIKDTHKIKQAFSSFRTSCKRYTSNPIIRNYILSKYNHQCVICLSKEDLQIDHITSVYRCFHDNELYYCNSEDNLQVLCKSCNCIKGSK